MATDISWDEIKKENVDLVRVLHNFIFFSPDFEPLKMSNV